MFRIARAAPDGWRLLAVGPQAQHTRAEEKDMTITYCFVGETVRMRAWAQTSKTSACFSSSADPATPPVQGTNFYGTIHVGRKYQLGTVFSCMMRCLASWTLLASLILWLLPLAAQNSQAPVPKRMDELLGALKDRKLTTLQKDRLIGKAYSGVVEIADIEDFVELLLPPAEPKDGDRHRASGRYELPAPTTKPAARIMVGVKHLDNDSPQFLLVFETTDVENAGRLRRGDQVSISGNLVRFEHHRSEYINVPDKEWAVFEQVIVKEK